MREKDKDETKREEIYFPPSAEEGIRQQHENMGLGKWYDTAKSGKRISGFTQKKWLGEPISYETIGNTRFPVYRRP